MNKNFYKFKWSLTGIIIFIFACFLLCTSYGIIGAKKGVFICLNSLIPSLFPFMILSNFIILTPIKKYIGIIFKKITEKLFKLSGKYTTAIIFSLIGGYPIGASILSEMLKKEETNIKTVERALCFCVNCGPAFLIGTIGIGLMNNYKIGLILFIAQSISAIIIASISAKNILIPHKYYETEDYFSFSDALVLAITNSTFSMLKICGFVVAFMTIISVFNQLNLIRFLTDFIYKIFPLGTINPNILESSIYGLIEVTSGIFFFDEPFTTATILAFSFITAFGGFSVFCQVSSFFIGYKINFKPMIIAKSINAFLSTSIAFVLLKIFPQSIPTFHIIGTKSVFINTNSILYTLCMIFLCSILFLKLKNITNGEL